MLCPFPKVENVQFNSFEFIQIQAKTIPKRISICREAAHRMVEFPSILWPIPILGIKISGLVSGVNDKGGGSTFSEAHGAGQ